MYIQYSEFRATRVFQGKRKLLKILNDKNISIQWKISGPLVFFRASAICSTILNDKKYIFNTVNSMQVLLSGLAQIAQKSW